MSIQVTVYLGRDNEQTIVLERYDQTRRKQVPLDLSDVTRMELVLFGTDDIGDMVFDSQTEPGVIDWTQGNGVVEFHLETYDVVAGVYSAQLVAYTPTATDGVVLLDNKGISDAEFIFVDKFGTGVTPVPTPGQTRVNSFNSRSGDVVLLSDDVVAALGYVPASSTAGVESVNGNTGAVVLAAADVGAAPSSHVGAGGSVHAVATTSEAGFLSSTDKTKLDGVASGATANSPDATLLNRANHTGTQSSSTISDFNASARAQTEAELVAGSNITITPSGTGATRQLTISSTGGGGGGGATIREYTTGTLPAAGNLGNIALLTDKNLLVYDNGTSWLPWGPEAKFVAPPTSGWSWVNQGTSTITSSAYDQVLAGGAAGAGPNCVLRVRSAPATPYTITAHVRTVMAHKAYQSYGLCFRNSSSGALHIFDVIASDLGLTTVAIRSAKFNSGTSYNADYITMRIPQMVNWMRIADDGTNRICSISEDGLNWLVIHTVGRTDFITADQVGIAVGVENSATPNFAPILRLLSWAQT